MNIIIKNRWIYNAYLEFFKIKILYQIEAPDFITELLHNHYFYIIKIE